MKEDMKNCKRVLLKKKSTNKNLLIFLKLLNIFIFILYIVS